MYDPRPAMRDELHHLVDIVARKPNGVGALSILIDQAHVLAAYKSTRGSIESRAAKPRRKPKSESDWVDGLFGQG